MLKHLLCKILHRHNVKNMYSGNKILGGNPSFSVCRWCGSHYYFLLDKLITNG